MTQSNQRPPVTILVTASAFSPFAMTLCVPALPAIQKEFGISFFEVQFVMSFFLLGLALAQPLHGILADRYGRRPVLLWGFGLFTLSSFACAYVGDIYWFILFRFLQAIGIASGIVVARAIIRDMTTIDETARYTAYLAAGMGIAPMLAPMLSGFLIEESGWRSSFQLTAVLSVFVLVWLLSALPETRKHIDSVESGFSQMRRNLLSLSRSLSFWGYTLIYSFANAAFFAFLTNSPAFFINVLNTGPAIFGVCMGAMSFFYIFGAMSGSLITQRVGMDKSLQYGLIGVSVSCLVMFVSISLLPTNLFSLIIPFFLLFSCQGLVNPTAMAGSMKNHADKAATASGLSSSFAMAIGGVTTMLTSVFYSGSAISLCIPVFLAIFITVLSYSLVHIDKQHE